LRELGKIFQNLFPKTWVSEALQSPSRQTDGETIGNRALRAKRHSRDESVAHGNAVGRRGQESERRRRNTCLRSNRNSSPLRKTELHTIRFTYAGEDPVPRLRRSPLFPSCLPTALPWATLWSRLTALGLGMSVQCVLHRLVFECPMIGRAVQLIS